MTDSGYALRVHWEKSHNGIGSVETQLRGFLFECATMYLRELKSKEPAKYSVDLEMFDAKDEQWLYYTRVIIHALHQIYRKTNTDFNEESCVYSFNDLVSVAFLNEITNWSVCVSILRKVNTCVCLCFRLHQLRM